MNEHEKETHRKIAMTGTFLCGNKSRKKSLADEVIATLGASWLRGGTGVHEDYEAARRIIGAKAIFTTEDEETVEKACAMYTGYNGEVKP